jgi:hypothetical protein
MTAIGSLRTAARVVFWLMALKVGRGEKRFTAGGNGERARREGEMEELVVARCRMFGRRVLVDEERESEEERERLDMEVLRGWSSGMVSEGVLGSSLGVVGSSQLGGQSTSQTDDSAVAHSLFSDGAEVVGLTAHGSWDRPDTMVISERSVRLVSSSSWGGHGKDTGEGGLD